jgi:hypothetical protein
MKKTLKALCVFGLLGAAVGVTASTPASAITAALANQCRAMALKAYPRKLAGNKGGTATAERKYFQDCVAKGGGVPENNTSDTPATTPATTPAAK